MADIQGATPVSATRDVNSASNPLFIKVSDGTNLAAVDATTNALKVQAQANAGVVIGQVKLSDGTDLLGVFNPGDTATGATGLLVMGSDGTNVRSMPSMDAAARPGFVKVTDGTNTLPTGDALARSIFTRIGDGTTGATLKAASTAPVATDTSLVVALSPNSLLGAIGSPGFVKVTDGTNLMPTADAAGRALFSKITDGATTLPVIVSDYDTGAGTQNLAMFGIALPANGGAVPGGTQTNPLMQRPTDGTNFMPMLDAVARAGFVKVTDGTNTLSAPASGDSATGVKGLVVLGSDGTNVRALPSLDAATRAGFVKITDGTTTGSFNGDGGLNVHVVNASGDALADNAAFTEGTTDFTPVGGLYHSAISALTDGHAGVAALTANRALHVNLRDASGNAVGASPAAPLYVSEVSGGGSVVADYNTAANVTGNGGTSNHDYTVTTGKTLYLSEVIGASSGAAKWELKTGPLATLATVAVGFTTVAEPTLRFSFEPTIAVPDTGTGTVRLVRTNRETLALDMYSTILGTEA